MKDINLRKDSPSQVTQVDPQEVSNEIQKLQDVQEQITHKESEIKELKDREKYLGGVIIPDLMNQMNLKTLKLRDGSEIEVQNKFFASILAAKKEEAKR